MNLLTFRIAAMRSNFSGYVCDDTHLYDFYIPYFISKIGLV